MIIKQICAGISVHKQMYNPSGRSPRVDIYIQEQIQGGGEGTWEKHCNLAIMDL